MKVTYVIFYFFIFIFILFSLLKTGELIILQSSNKLCDVSGLIMKGFIIIIIIFVILNYL
jgi:hypothetical protein